MNYSTPDEASSPTDITERAPDSGFNAVDNDLTPKKVNAKADPAPARSLAEKIERGLGRLALPKQLDGEDIGLVPEKYGLHLTESAMAFGINTAALYGKKSSTAKLNPTMGILLRLFAAFPEHLPRVTPPTPASLFNTIRHIDHTFKGYYVGPMLGMEVNSSYRIHKDGFESSTQTVRSLAALIEKILLNDPDDWTLIQQAVEMEASAWEVSPVQNVWSKGGWKSRKADLLEKGIVAGSRKQPVKKKPERSTAKKPIRRSTES